MAPKSCRSYYRDNKKGETNENIKRMKNITDINSRLHFHL